MAIPFLSDIRLPSAGKVYLWTGHNDNFLKYDLWQASASAGMTIKNIANSGSIIFQTNSTTALTLDSSQNVIANAFTGKLQGAVTGAPDTTIWHVSSEYTNWGIFYNQGTPDKIEFKAAGTVTSSIALDNGNISTTGSITATSNSAVIQTPRISMEADGTLDWGQTRGHGTLTWDTGKIMIRALGGNSMELQTNGSTTALTLDASQNATFDGYLKLSGPGNASARQIHFLAASGESNTEPMRITRYQDKMYFTYGENAGDEAFWINSDGTTQFEENVTFAGTLDVNGTSPNTFAGNIIIENVGPIIQASSTNNASGLRLNVVGIGNNSNHLLRVQSGGTTIFDIRGNANATFNGSVTAATGFIADAVSASNNDPGTDNVQFSGYGMIGNRGNLYITNANTDSTATVQIGVGGIHNGSPKLTIGASTSHIRTNLLPGTDSTYNIGSSATRFSNIYADTLHGTVAEANNLNAFDDRDIAPEDLSFSDDLKLFFAEKTGIEGGTVGSDWQDLLILSSYVDSSGGKLNALALDKSGHRILHYNANHDATNWGTAKELAYTSDFVKRTGGSSTSMSGDLHIITGAPKIYLQDSTDDDDQQIIFRNNGGSDEYKIATQDFTSAATGDGLFIGSETSDPVKLVTNDTIALAIDSSQHVSLPGAYLTLKDLNSHAQIEASSSSLMLKAVNIQAQGNFIPDGSGSRSLGSSGRYWSETYTNGVTSGGNIVINSNTPVLTLGVVNSSTGNAKIQLYSKNSGISNSYAVQYNKDTGIDRLEFVDGSGTANIKFNNGGAAEFAGSVTATQINTGQGATEVHLMNQNVRTSDNVQFADLTLTGNLNLYGDINTQNVTNLDVTDKVITVGKGQDEGHSGGSGLLVDGSGASILWDESNDTWDFNKGINVGGHIELDSARGVVFDNGNNNNAWYIRNGGSNSATLQFGLGASPGSNIKHTFEGDGSVSFATYVNAATGFRMASGQAIDFISTNIGYNSIERNTSVGGLQINTGNAASMNILDNGTIGIGTNTPGRKLHVYDDNAAAIKIQAGDANQARLDLANSAGAFGIITNGGAFRIYDDTDNAERLKIDTSGNVGIGDTAPTNISANTFSLSVNSSRTDLTGALVSKANGTIKHQQYWDSGGYAFILTGSSGDFKWNFGSSEKMRLTETGKVGIGVTSPARNLHIHQGDSTLSYLQITNTTTGVGGGDGVSFGITSDEVAIWNNRENTDTAISTNNTERIRIKNNGRVGIGLTAVKKDLEIEIDNSNNVVTTGNSLLGGDSGAGVLIRNSNTTTNSYANLDFRANNADGRIAYQYTGTANQGDFHFVTDNTSSAISAMVIKNEGKIGIGTTSPGTNLQVNSSTNTATSIGISNTGSGASRLYMDASNGDFSGSDYMWIGQNNDLSGEIFMAQNAGSFHIKTQPGGTATTQFTLTQAGDVGIGTTSPAEKLEVNGSIKLGSMKLENISAGGRIGFNRNTSNGAIYNSGYEAFQIQANGSGYLETQVYNSSGGYIGSMSLTDDVKLGIGTNSPTYKLSVAGAISGSGFVTYTKSYSSLNATGNAVAGITTGSNGASCGFTFTCFGGTGKYQKVVYSCYNDAGTWRPKKVIDEGTNDLDVAASADGSTITFTFKATSSSQSYSPRVKVEADGQNINSTYA